MSLGPGMTETFAQGELFKLVRGVRACNFVLVWESSRVFDPPRASCILPHLRSSNV